MSTAVQKSADEEFSLSKTFFISADLAGVGLVQHQG